jgi:hypothetical protein
MVLDGSNGQAAWAKCPSDCDSGDVNKRRSPAVRFENLSHAPATAPSSSSVSAPSGTTWRICPRLVRMSGPRRHKVETRLDRPAALVPRRRAIDVLQ